MATLATLEVDLKANTAAITRGFRQVNQRADALGRTVKRLGATFAGVFAGRQILRGLQDVTRAWAVQEEAVQSLNAALMVTGKDGVENLERLTASAARLQAVTTKGDEAIISATATLAQLATKLRPDELEQAQRAIIGIADTFLKGDIENAALLVGKSLSSTTNALTRYGIQLDTSASQGEKLTQVLQQSERFFLVSQERAKTLSGRLQQLGNAWGDLKEQIGRVIATSSGATGFFKGLTDVIGNVTTILQRGNAEQIKEAFAILGKLAGNAFSVAFLSSMRWLIEQMGKVGEAIAESLYSKIPGGSLIRGIGDLVRGIDDAFGTAARNFTAFDGAIAGAQENMRLLLRDLENISLVAATQPARGGPSPALPAAVGAAQLRAPTITITPTIGTVREGGTRSGVGLERAAELVRQVQDNLTEQQRAYADRLRQAAEATQFMAGTVADSFATMVSAAVSGAANMQNAIISAVNNIAQALIQLKAQQAGGGLFGAILGPIAGLGIGLLGGLLFGGGRREAVPVTIEEYSPRALNQQRQTGPTNVTVKLYGADGQPLGVLQRRLNERSRRDAVERLPSGIVLGV